MLLVRFATGRLLELLLSPVQPRGRSQLCVVAWSVVRMQTKSPSGIRRVSACRAQNTCNGTSRLACGTDNQKPQLLMAAAKRLETGESFKNVSSQPPRTAPKPARARRSENRKSLQGLKNEV